MSARETAERHAQDVVDANFERLASDIEPDTLNAMLTAGIMPPTPTTQWSILSETPDGDVVRFHVRYANDTEALELRTTWAEREGAWKIIDIEKL